MITRLRERASYLPARTQGRIASGAGIVAFVVAVVLDHELRGVASEAFTYVSVFLFGVAVALVLIGQRRR